MAQLDGSLEGIMKSKSDGDCEGSVDSTLDLEGSFEGIVDTSSKGDREGIL
jgi:cytoskeletal protein CcmA (bactofilin family)